ncbi:MAG: DMT family transporter [Clostridia bacterium]|nr:DMT family transporter [Clostridia bacterium]
MESNKRNSKKILAHVFALFSIIVWGSCYVLTKNLLAAGFTALQITPIRMALAYVVLLVMRPKFRRLSWKDELMFVLIGIFGGSVYFFLQNTALTYTYAANVSIIVCLSPIFTAVLAVIFSRGNERLGKFLLFGSVLAIAGVVLVVLNGSLNFHLSPVGDLLALAAGISWAVYSILIKPYTETMDGFLVTRRVMFWAFLTSIPLMLLSDGMPNLAPLFAETKVLFSWLFLGILGNAVCFALWNVAFKELGVVVTNNYLYGSPFVTLIVGFLLLNEPISWMGVVGAVLITAGVILAQRDKRA